MSVFITVLFAAAAVMFAAAFFTITLCRPEKTAYCEKLARNRNFGVILAAAALFWCVPHAEMVVFDFMKKYLLLLAAAGTVLGYFFVDYLFARGLGGLLILGGYSLVHGSFEYSLPGAAAVAVAGWVLGVAGILVSGRPAWFRDVIRCCCRNRGCRITVVAVLILYSAILIYCGVASCLSR